jgi:hypothetical protein
MGRRYRSASLRRRLHQLRSVTRFGKQFRACRPSLLSGDEDCQLCLYVAEEGGHLTFSITVIQFPMLCRHQCSGIAINICSFRWFIMAESAVCWFIVREKHCWIAANLAEPAKRRGWKVGISTLTGEANRLCISYFKTCHRFLYMICNKVWHLWITL